MKHRIGRITAAAAALVIGLSAVGCQSTQLRDQLEDQERMIRQLRQDKASAEQRLKAKDGEVSQARTTAEQARQRAGSLEAQLNSLKAQKAAKPEVDDLTRQRDELRRSLGRDADVDIRDGDIVITLPNRVTFSSGSSNLTGQGQNVLSRLLASLRTEYSSHPISIEGHTDSDPIRKSKFETNWRLSVERAMAVRDYLESQGKLPADRFRVVGYGPHRPLARNDSQAGKQQNRRVEIVILNS